METHSWPSPRGSSFGPGPERQTYNRGVIISPFGHGPWKQNSTWGVKISPFGPGTCWPNTTGVLLKSESLQSIRDIIHMWGKDKTHHGCYQSLIFFIESIRSITVSKEMGKIQESCAGS